MTAPKISRGLKSLLAPVGELTPDPDNARIHDRRSIEAIAASLARFGQQKPIVCDRAGVTVAGAGVLLAAMQLGWSHVAAVRTELAGAERDAFAIADNRTPELSVWDNEALRELVASMPDDLTAASGFTADELAQLIAPNDSAVVMQDEVPMPSRTPVAAKGDLWCLGNHRLLCGNSTKPADVARLMNGERARLFATDPPYLVAYAGMEWDSAVRSENRGLYLRFILAAMPHLDRSAAWYCWHASATHSLLADAWRRAGAAVHCQIIWVKNKPTFGRSWYMWQHEPCLMGWRKGAAPGGPSVGQKMSTVWTIDTIANADRPDHPTPKPIEVFSIPMQQHTRPGDVCYEPFSGSGSQLVAAEQLQRRCFAMELEPAYVDVAIRRWEKITGKQAVLDGTKLSWREVAKKRGVRLDDACPKLPAVPASTPDAKPSPKAATASSTPPSTSPKHGRPPKGPRAREATARRGGGSAR